MATVLFRTLIMYLLLIAVMKIMGKRQIGELEISELVSTLLISELAAIPIADPDIPMFNAIIPILFIFGSEILLSSLKNKSDLVKGAIEGKPVILISRGVVQQKALEDSRLSLNEVLTEMRSQGIADLGDVQYAILEPSGKISVLKLGFGEHFAYSIVIDGTVSDFALKELNLDRFWLDEFLSKKKTNLKDVFYLGRSACGKTLFIPKEKSK